MNRHRYCLIPIILALIAQAASADYASLQASDCTLLTEFTGSGSWEFLRFINSSTNCSPYTLIGSTTPATIQVFGKCTNGDILNGRFDVFTYDGTRGNEVGHSRIYQAGGNFPLFACDNRDRNVDGTLRIPLGTNQSFFVAVSDTASSTQVKELFENGIGGGGFAYALIHFDIKSAPTEPQKPDPVIIIPGILGSSDKNGVWVIDPIFHTYDDLISTLKANGYTDGKDLFTFPYDWRQSNIITAIQLRDKINEAQNVCKCAKVDLVAHSMGGLVARQYIQSTNYGNDVDQLIFLGTPHLGAPKAYLMWEGGTVGVEFSIVDLLFNAYLRQYAFEAGFGLSNSKATEVLFNYIHSPSSPMLSLQELLPAYSYLKNYDTGALREYPADYPQNIFLENLNATPSLDLLLQSGAKISNVFSDSENNTLNFINVRQDSSTLPLWEHGVPKALEKGSGDRTVPTTSALSLNTANTVDINIPAEHTALPSIASSEVMKTLTGKLPITVIHTSPIKKLLSFFALSPIDFLITAPDGKRIGKDFSTGQEINEIVGAFYSGFGTENENIFIPNPLDGEYIITTQGTGNGSYQVLTDYISEESTGEATSTTAIFAANTATGLATELNILVDSANLQNLNIQPTDVTPPEINIISPQAKNYLRSEILPININVQDTESGVASQEIRFDDRIVNNGQNVDLFFERLGEHKISINAADFVGNAASAEISFRVIATIESTVSDIERAYSLDWIQKRSVKNNLIRSLNKDHIRNFTRLLEREHPRNINDQAYNLLKEDINWLLNI